MITQNILETFILLYFTLILFHVRRADGFAGRHKVVIGTDRMVGKTIRNVCFCAVIHT